MPNYLIKYNDITQHYFHIPNQGLCVRNKHHSIWQNHKILYQDCKDVFSVFCDRSGILHAICINSKNEIIYLVLKQGSWQSYQITRLKEDMKVSEIVITETKIGLSLIYTAEYLGETFLIHCILGNKAMPETLDRVSNPEFFIFRKRVYYTNTEGFLGYRDISDGKANNFNKLVENAAMPHLLFYDQKDMIVYKKNNKIYFQNRPVHEDSNAIHPILLHNSNQLFLMWQNGDFIRYISSSDSGKSWSGVMQFVNPGKISQIYHVINNSNHYLYFGNHSNTDLHIYSKADIFEPEPKIFKPKNVPNQDPAQITKLKILIEMQKKEISELKKEIHRLGDIIKTLPKISQLCIDENAKNNPPKSDIM